MRISSTHFHRMKRRTLRIVRSPLVEQEFSYNAPGALRVQLVGSFTRWQSNPVSMIKGEDGIWRAKMKLLPGRYHYRFIVDGEWRDDPECTLRVPNGLGSSNALREVPLPERRRW